MHVTKIDIDRSPLHEQYEQTVRVWFNNGGSIRFVEDTDGRIVEQGFKADDPDSVWDDFIVLQNGEQSLQEFVLVTISVLMNELRNEQIESSMLKAVTGNESPTPTNVEYEQ